MRRGLWRSSRSFVAPWYDEGIISADPPSTGGGLPGLYWCGETLEIEGGHSSIFEVHANCIQSHKSERSYTRIPFVDAISK